MSHPAGVRWIEYRDDDEVFEFYPLGDTHIGDRGSARDMIDTTVERIRVNPRAFWHGMGDYASYLHTSDRRFDAAILDPELICLADVQAIGAALSDRVAEMLDPIKDKCTGMLFGNHEDSYMRAKDQGRLHANLCEKLGVPNVGYSCFVDLRFYRRPRGKRRWGLGYDVPAVARDILNVRVFAHHGTGSARTVGAKINRLSDALKKFDANVVLLAHAHMETTTHHVRIGADAECRTITAKQSIGYITASYLRTYAQDVDGYGEKALYDAVLLGCSPIEICPSKRTVHAGSTITL